MRARRQLEKELALLSEEVFFLFAFADHFILILYYLTI